MAHFAEINSENIVLDILVVDNKDITPDENNTEEEKGLAFLKNLFGDERKFVQCSFGTIKNKYYVVDSETGEYTYDESLQHKKLRKNFPEPDWIWDPERNCFYEPKMYDSWVFNEDTASYEAPVPYPNDGEYYEWDEVTKQWISV